MENGQLKLLCQFEKMKTFLLCSATLLLFIDYASPSPRPSSRCPIPYKLIGDQCLFFSQPFAPWGITESWKEAYLNYYDAIEMCKVIGGGILAESVRNFKAASKYCLRSRGNCAPSLISRNDICFQWSPVDGSEIPIPCRQWEMSMRYICEWRPPAKEVIDEDQANDMLN